MKMLLNRGSLAFVCLLLIVLAALSAVYAAAEQPATPNKNSECPLRAEVGKATSSFKDLTATVLVDYKNDQVLAKIGKRYAQQYELKKGMVRFKAPDKTRLEGALGALKLTYITNRDFKIIKIKPIGYEKKESISDKPHRRQGAIDLGLVTTDMWSDYVVSEKGTEGEGDNACYVFDLTRGDQYSNLHRVWISKKTLSLVKMEKYDPDKVTQRLSYKYLEPVLVEGVWVPTKIEMYAPTGELAGTTKIQEIKVNTGLQDSLFK